MGDIKKQRKKYVTPLHPWNRTRIEEEKILVEEYGLKNKKEIMKAESLLRQFKHSTKKVIAKKGDAQAQKEFLQLKNKLSKLGLMKEGARLEDILDLTKKDILERRLQTVVVRKHLARSPNQARQFITHRHIQVGTKTITAPGHLVTVEEETNILFKPSSTLSNPEHPERLTQEQISNPIVKKEKKKPMKKKPQRRQEKN